MTKNTIFLIYLGKNGKFMDNFESPFLHLKATRIEEYIDLIGCSALKYNTNTTE